MKQVGTENLEKIFNPQRIAVIGASDRETSIGARLLRNLVGVGHKRVVYPVNPFRSTVQGITAYPSIIKIPWRVDLAIIATPAHTVPQIVEECGKAGVPGIIIVSAGFRESNDEGVAFENEIIGYRDRYNMRIIGPSSFGVMRPRIGLNATFSNRVSQSASAPSFRPASIAFVSQSAALCASVLDWASEAHIELSAVVSTGSMIDVDVGDLIDYFESDPQTKSIVLYIESIRNVRKFMSAARGVARAKPIVVVKAGRFPQSARATLSHVGSMCGEDDLYDAAFRRAGAVRVEAISDLFSCAEALSMQPNPRGPYLTVITNAGGPGIIAIDALVARGGKLAQLTDETVRALKDVLPPYSSFMNPIDVFEEASVDRFRRTIDICFKNPSSDGFLIIYTPQGMADPIATANAIIELSKETTKPVLTSILGESEDCWKARQILRRNSVPSYATPEQAVSTFLYMYSYTQNLELLYQTPEELSVEISIPTFLKEILKKAVNEGRDILNLPESLQFLAAYGIPTIETVVAKTPEEAQTIASRLGYPVVMKAVSQHVTHKSDAEGVILNVWSQSEVKTFFEELAVKIRNYNPEARMQGVAIQPMIRRGGYELLIGTKKDPQFGSVIVFSAGGTAANWFKDSSIGFPPLNQILARRLIERTSIYKHLNSKGGFQNLKLLEELLVRFSQFVIDFPEIKEIDINPLLVGENDAVAVDARIIIDRETFSREIQSHEHLVIAPYPKKFVTNWQLRDGASILLRPIRPEDELLFLELFQSLSEESMRFRFFQIIKDITHETLTRYCNIDYDREMAIVAETQQEKKIIGAARLITEPGKRSGEFAVLVSDAWHGRGLGSKLLETIIDIAKSMVLDSIYGYVMSENSKMMSLCTKKGFGMEPFEEGVEKATLKLS